MRHPGPSGRKSIWKRMTHRRVGGAILETVLVLPILLALAFGTVEFGYYFYVKHSLEGAARDGARAAIVSGAVYSDISSAVTTAMTASNLSSSGYTVLVQDNGSTIVTLSSAVAGDMITVQVSATWGVAGAGYRPWALIGTAKVVTGSAVMRKESWQGLFRARSESNPIRKAAVGGSPGFGTQTKSGAAAHGYLLLRKAPHKRQLLRERI